jgi:hypothetical protein
MASYARRDASDKQQNLYCHIACITGVPSHKANQYFSLLGEI